MADYVTIANLSLGKVGEPYRISDPNEDTPAARAVKAAWDLSRRTVLRQGKFNFAQSRAELAAQAPTDPGYVTPFPFANRFPVAALTIRLVEVYDADGCLLEDYRYEARAILTDNDGPLTALTVADVVDMGAWDDLFVATFAELLAYEIADTMTGDPARKAACWNAYRQRLAESLAADAREDPPEAPYDSSWVTARESGFIGGGPPNV